MCSPVGRTTIARKIERNALCKSMNSSNNWSADVEDDIIKAQAGNKAAGTRVRRAMQEIKQTAQTLRIRILEARSHESDAG